ncbi:MAG: thioredoxin family protein [Alphaproteobacteria bacterium]|nr:thioredoxin family protein [Alphaproteobacteria bacterium]
MTPLGSPLPSFALPDTEGRVWTPDDLPGRALVVAFVCVHCPYVVHVKPSLPGILGGLIAEGASVVAVHSNDAVAYPADGPDEVAREARALGLPYPSLLDATQEVARAFGAACTPDWFVYDGDRRLVYRGQLDASRPGNGLPVTGEDLVAAVRAVLAGEAVRGPQRPSLGCNLKWKA